MCRWFAYVSPTEPALLEDILITPSNSLSHQVHDHYLPKLLPHNPQDLKDDKAVGLRNSLWNLDGIGIAWYTKAQSDFHKDDGGSRPALYKSISPPINDFNIRSMCANTSSKAVFAHIRASSGSVVQQSNCHPFVFGRHTFMHNGVVAHFTDIRRDLCDLLEKDAFSAVTGSTDSEHMGALYMTFLSTNKKDVIGRSAWEIEYTDEEMAAAMIAAIQRVLELQHRTKGKDMRPSSLNLAATDGRRMVAVRFRNCVGEEPPSLYYSTTAGVTLNRKYPGHPNSEHEHASYQGFVEASEHGKHVIISSEPTTFDEKEWNLIPRNTMVLVDEHGEMKTTPATYDRGLDAVDPST